MDRHIEKIDESHDKEIRRMAGTVERDKYMRTYPDPMPAGYVLRHRWSEDTMTLETWVEKAEEPGASGSNANSGLPESTKNAIKTIAEHDLSKELQALSDPDLEDRAAREGVPTKDGKGKKLTKAVIIASIVEKK